MPDPYAPRSDDGESSKIGAILAPYKPIMSKLTISSVMGYCSAITAKRVGKGIAFIAGLGFIALQGMVYSGFVSVDWKKVEKSAVDALDTVSSCLSSSCFFDECLDNVVHFCFVDSFFTSAESLTIIPR
jgi:uncharacterized membrane protein (Fun14 family)